MNVAYDKFDTNDVAKIFSVAPQTVTAWVRKGHMDAVNVSDGTTKGRYMFTDEEVTRVQKLVDKYGKHAWPRHSCELKALETIEEIPEVVVSAPVIKDELPVFNPDKLVNKIERLQELKEECENAKAKYNQLCKEVTMLREEIISQL